MKITCPHCNQPYEIDESLSGHDLECGVCGKKFTASGPVPLRPVEVKTNVKQGAVIGAWVCLVLGVVLNIFTNFLLIIFLPLYLAAFVLSIVAMAQRRIGWGLASLILTVLLPPVIFMMNIGRFAAEVDAAKEESKSTAVTVAPVVEKPVSVADKKTSSPAVVPPVKTSSSAVANPKKSVPEVKEKKEISGLCGIKFGSRFQKNNNRNNSSLNSGETLYAVSAPRKFMGFTNYYLLITPTSEKVYSIWMVREFKKAAEGRAEFDKVAAVLENHYKIKGERELSIDPVTIFNFDNGYIILKLNIGLGEYSLELRGYSKEFSDLAEKEKKDYAVRSTDTSAL